MNHGQAVTLTPGDFDVCWRTVWQEARGEPNEGRRAVMHVIINRLNYRQKDRWNTLAQVCLDWLQFSGWRETDPNFKKAQALTLADPDAQRAAFAVLGAMLEPDFTHGARHYHSDAIMPSWVQGKVACLVLGRHLFYNDVA